MKFRALIIADPPQPGGRTERLLRRLFADAELALAGPDRATGAVDANPGGPDLVLLDGIAGDPGAALLGGLAAKHPPGPPALWLSPRAADARRLPPEAPAAFLRAPCSAAELAAHVRALLRAGAQERALRESEARCATEAGARRAAEEALQAARRSAASADRAKNEFLAHMSHEIRTPMNAIIGMTELLMATDLSENQRDYVETIRSGGEMLLTVINDILDFTKIEAGRMDLEQRPFGLGEWMDGSLGMVRVMAERKQLALRSRIREGTPTRLVGDLIRLRQVLGNLLSNAVKFTERGHVAVTVGALHLGEGRCMLRVSVEDSGIGIPPDRRDRLFQAFSQVDSSTTRRFGGTGLGLAICRKLVELMGGAIWVESEPARGSTFHFTVPLDVEAAEPEPPRGLAGRRALVAAPEPAPRQHYAALLRQWGLTAVEAATPDEALATASGDEPFDLVLVDAAADRDAGVRLAIDLRRRCASEQTAILVCGPRDDPGGRTTDPALRDDGAISGWLAAPVRPEELKGVLTRMLSRTAAADPADASVEALPRRVLVVEDNPINRKVVLRMLERLGVPSDTAENGELALQQMRRADYDVVLMDVQMPVLDGFEATHHIRQEWPADRQPWIIAITAHAMRGDREKCLSARMDDYMSKPLREEDLRRALQRPRRAAGKTS